MFGANPIMKVDHGDGQELRIVRGSPFYTIQGEGPYAGHPAVFIRLHGCNLRCWFCDTNFSDPEDPKWGIAKLGVEAVNLGPTRLIVLTGGEPMRQNIVPFCQMVKDRWPFLTIQIETAGTVWLPGIEALAEIVCSPKTPTIHPMIHQHAKAFKYVIGADMEFGSTFIPITNTQSGTGRVVKLAAPRRGAPVYLSPLDEYNEFKNAKNKQLVAKMAMAYGCIAGVQLHKIMHIEEPT